MTGCPHHTIHFNQNQFCIFGDIWMISWCCCYFYTLSQPHNICSESWLCNCSGCWAFISKWHLFKIRNSHANLIQNSRRSKMLLQIPVLTITCSYWMYAAILSHLVLFIAVFKLARVILVKSVWGILISEIWIWDLETTLSINQM